ncbi:Adaptive-response sensory-kinase SasA [subsurface metagenome]
MKDSPLQQHISETEKIVLSYKQSVLSFHFAAMDFTNPDKNQFAYMMENFDREWIYSGNRREATYTNLDPDEYCFKVIGSNNDGVWNTTGVSLDIVILPPWWQTIWFKAIVLFIVLSFVISFYYLRVYQLKKQRNLLEKRVNERTKEVEEKNRLLHLQTKEMNETNTNLEERQQQIEEQAEELKAQAEELSKTNDTLKTLNATKDKFFSIIAHDLKNPFTSILGFCEILKIRYKKMDDSKKQNLINIIHQSSNNLYKLLENLLQWARSQTGNLKYTPEEFHIHELIQNITSLVNNSVAQKGLQLTADIPEDLKVYADKNMIYTVIRNLVTNAIKFTDQGEIKIQVKEEPKQNVISVTDSGVGIQKDKTETIFEISKSKSTEGTRGESGTGLGLIICKEFVEINGGSIHVQSVAGEGSSFYFTIPRKIK